MNEAEALRAYVRSEPMLAAFLAYDEAMGNTAHLHVHDFGNGDGPIPTMDTATMQRFCDWVGTARAERFKSWLGEQTA
jgi:hypothetical protein